MRCVIVILKEREFEVGKSEIMLLCRTAGYEVERVFTQNAAPRAKFLIGPGKVEEIKRYVAEKGVDLVVFENYLTSRQVMSLERAFRRPVIDKFDLILNVFEKHARNKEAKLQIELARLK